MTIFYNVLPFPTPPAIAEILEESAPDVDMLLWIEAQKMDAPSRFTEFARERATSIFLDHFSGAAPASILRVLPFDDTALCARLLAALQMHSPSMPLISSITALLADEADLSRHQYLQPTSAQITALSVALRACTTSYRAFKFVLRNYERNPVFRSPVSVKAFEELFRANRTVELEERMVMVLARASVNAGEEQNLNAVNYALIRILKSELA